MSPAQSVDTELFGSPRSAALLFQGPPLVVFLHCFFAALNEVVLDPVARCALPQSASGVSLNVDLVYCRSNTEPDLLVFYGSNVCLRMIDRDCDRTLARINRGEQGC